MHGLELQYADVIPAVTEREASSQSVRRQGRFDSHADAKKNSGPGMGPHGVEVPQNNAQTGSWFIAAPGEEALTRGHSFSTAWPFGAFRPRGAAALRLSLFTDIPACFFL
jgi:hypothetical protein